MRLVPVTTNTNFGARWHGKLDQVRRRALHGRVDGGAMDIAAALGKPIVCFFGNSGADRWHPWRVPHQLMQPPSRDVADVGVEEAVAAYERLVDERR